MSNYYITKPDGTQEGPYDKATLIALVKNHTYSANCYIWCEGMAAWKPFREVLTTELWALRRTVEPVVRKICRMFLALEGLDDRVEILWNDISLQDITEEAKAELYKAQAAKARAEANKEKGEV